MKAYGFLLSFLVIFPLAGCDNGSGDENQVVWEVDNHMSVANGAFFSYFHFRVREPGADDWEKKHNIKGFDYEWGYDYAVKVEVVEIEDPVADHPAVEYHLIEVLDKQRAREGIYFNVEVYDHQDLVKTGVEQIYEVYGEKFSCEPAMCEAIDSLKQQELSVDLMFTHSTDSSVPLVAKQINCSAPRETFGEECLQEN